MSYACSCKAVRDQTVIAAIIEGARSVEDITEACEAGSDCRTCIPVLEDLLYIAETTGLIEESESAGSLPA